MLQRVLLAVDLVRGTQGSSARIYTLTTACQEAGISRTSFLKYIRSDPDLLSLFEDAENESYDLLAEQSINIDQIHSDPKMAAVISKNIQWFLARKKPKEYGDRVSVDVTLQADKTIIAALQAAKARIPHHAGPTLDLTAEEVRAEDLF